MNAWQISKELKSRLESDTWPGGVAVFGGVRVVGASFDDVFRNFRTPAIAIKIGPSVADDNAQGFLEQRIDILLIVAVAGDEIGENAVTGGNRTSGQTASHGRGLLEVEEEIKSTVRAMISDGFRLSLVAETDSEGVVLEGVPFAIHRTYTVLCRCTADRFYHPPRNLVAPVAGPSVSLSWLLPPPRYDLREIVVRRAAGSVPPPGPTSGTGIVLAGLLDTAVVDAPGAGMFSYSVFAGYDETGSGTNERFSDLVTGSFRAGVVV